jgi:dihydrofolate reductase
MRKIILNLAVSLDGFIEGPNGEYDWCLADQDYGMEDFLPYRYHFYRPEKL